MIDINRCLLGLLHNEMVAAKVTDANIGVLDSMPSIWTMIIFCIVVIVFICWTQWIYGYGDRDSKGMLFRKVYDQYGTTVEMA